MNIVNMELAYKHTPVTTDKEDEKPQHRRMEGKGQSSDVSLHWQYVRERFVTRRVQSLA